MKKTFKTDKFSDMCVSNCGSVKDVSKCAAAFQSHYNFGAKYQSSVECKLPVNR